MHYLKCPNCGSRGPIFVELTVIMTCENDGEVWLAEDYTNFDDAEVDPACECEECKHRGTEAAFKTDEPCGD